MKRYVLISFIVAFMAIILGTVTAHDTDFGPALSHALRTYDGIAYDWGKGAYCSTFVSEYLRSLGFNVAANNESPFSYRPEPGSPIPESNTLMQVRRFVLLDIELGGGHTSKIPIKDLLYSDSWTDLGIQPGMLIYFQVGIGHNGIDEYEHVVILSGFDSEGHPLFAEYAKGMSNGPMNNRTLKQTADGMYYSTDNRGWNLEPYNPEKTLLAFVVDVAGMINERKETRK